MRKWLLSYVIIYTVMAHVPFPFLQFTKNNFLFFCDWNLFSFGPKEEVGDLSFDDGKSFLLLDHFSRVGVLRRDFVNILTLINMREIDTLRRDYLPVLKEVCQCEKIEYIRFKSSYYQHWQRKKGREIVAKIEL